MIIILRKLFCALEEIITENTVMSNVIYVSDCTLKLMKSKKICGVILHGKK